MIVDPDQPFQLIYSISSHEYLGLLFESYVVPLDDKGRLSYAYQNISSANAREFDTGLDAEDYELIRIMDSMQQDVVVKPYMKKGNLKPKDYLSKIFDPKTADTSVQELLFKNLELKRAKILPLLIGKRLFETASDGNPTGREIIIHAERATVLFHFDKGEYNTQYYPTIKFQGQKLNWQHKGGYLVCKEPAWLIVDQQLFHFEKGIDGKKLQPFLSKNAILVERKFEPEYYRKFVASLITQFEVVAKGFDIHTEQGTPEALLSVSALPGGTATENLFGEEIPTTTEDIIVLEPRFKYGEFDFGVLLHAGEGNGNSCRYEEKDGNFTFFKTVRTTKLEERYLSVIRKKGLEFVHGKSALPKTQAFEWLGNNEDYLREHNIKIVQKNGLNGKVYHIGKANITIEVNENIDWFDVKALIKFGIYLVPFAKLRKLIIQGKHEFELPNGEIAVIPASWFVNYSELFNFIEERSAEELVLRKHHLAFARELQNGELIRLNLSLKLERLRNFDAIDDYSLPASFNGSLRPYQNAGYNWLRFLNEYQFGGCLADDMGLGKTVQTLALLAHEREENPGFASLLVMPTSLIYNWELEAKKFTPELKILVYSGSQRNKDPWKFRGYDVVLTSYGIVRMDIAQLNEFYFNYVILDESQAIKNPNSNIATAVNKLKSKRRLILTGTPVENGTMDLWSQMNFVNPGLLGNQLVFKKQFLQPIEKQHDKDKAARLHAMIKPFILRRLKSQVAKDLPEKITNVKYSDMTAEQEKVYEEVKTYYREKIIGELAGTGRGNQQFTLLRGLTQLRQIANHPKLVREDYSGESGKLEDITYMLQETISENHKVLVFSQFVRHLAIVREFLESENIPYAYLDGATKDRQAQVEKFQTDDNCKVFLISLKAGGVGLNLTKAEYVFLLDPWWNPAVEAQAIDRAHRIGQENKVIIYKFISRGSVEEKIMALQDRKLALAGELISNEESFMKSLDNADIRALLD
jgi:SNF2 family DNA or RNA helicase